MSNDAPKRIWVRAEVLDESVRGNIIVRVLNWGDNEVVAFVEPANVLRTAAYTAAYLDRIAELEAAQRWIPVEERLPEDRIRNERRLSPYVLAACQGPEGPYVASRSYSTLNKQWLSPDPVTHWMPLPPPPLGV